MPLVIVACAVAVLIFLIAKCKLNTFVSLVVVSILAALALKIPIGKIPSTIQDGIGSQLGDVAIIFGFGSMLGKLVSDSGGGYRIAMTLINKFGRKHIQIAVVLASFIIGIALFFEVGLVVLLPIIYAIAKELDMPLMELGLSAAVTLNVMHAFLPPHPAPTAITTTFGASVGQVMLYGIIAAIPTVIISGPLFNRLLRRIKPSLFHENIDSSVLGDYKEFKLEETPSFALSFVTAIMPVILIGIATICNFFMPKTNPVNVAIQFIGNADIAMLLSVIFAIWSMDLKQSKKMSDVSASMEGAIKQVGMMMLILGGGGAFKQVLVDGGVSKYVSGLFTGLNMSPLIAAWLVTAFLRVCVGSSTVSALAGAGLVLPMLQMPGVNPALMVLAVGAGSVFGDHLNDAGFWMVKEYFGLSLKETLESWTVVTMVISVVGLLAVLAISLFV